MRIKGLWIIFIVILCFCLIEDYHDYLTKDDSCVFLLATDKITVNLKYWDLDKTALRNDPKTIIFRRRTK